MLSKDSQILSLKPKSLCYTMRACIRYQHLGLGNRNSETARISKEAAMLHVPGVLYQQDTITVGLRFNCTVPFQFEVGVSLVLQSLAISVISSW